MDTFRLWACACSHIHSDLAAGRRSVAEAIAHSEFGGADGGPPFDWDIMLHLGDISGTQMPPADADGPPVVEQLASAKKHSIEQIYHLVGNHDASGPGEEYAMVVSQVDRPWKGSIRFILECTTSAGRLRSTAPGSATALPSVIFSF